MQLTKLLQTDTEERAVSPVIGVILMVAITVILAAVIASFVLGLGSNQEVAPTATFDFNYDTSNDQVEVTHTGGDNILQSNLYVRGSEIDTAGTGSDLTSNNQWDGTASATIDSNSAVTSGDSVTVALDSNPDEYVLRVTWESSEGTSSSELATDRGPDA
jgi:flagellin-like protein